MIIVLQPTHRPTGPDSTSHLIQNITKQRRKLQQHDAFRGTLDSFTQTEGGPVFEQKMDRWKDEWMDKRIKEGVRGQTAASRSLLEPLNQHNTAANAGGTRGGESGRLLRLHEDALCNEWLRKSTIQQESGFHNTGVTLSDTIKDTVLVSNESCSPCSCHHPKLNQIDQCFSPSE